MIEIEDQFAKDIITICQVYQRGIKLAIKPTFGKKKKQLNELSTDLSYIINTLEAKL